MEAFVFCDAQQVREHSSLEPTLEAKVMPNWLEMVWNVAAVSSSPGSCVSVKRFPCDVAGDAPCDVCQHGGTEL